MAEIHATARPMQVWWVFVVRGVLALALGAFALIWPSLTMSILVLFIGAWLIADGVMGLVVASRRGSGAGRWFQPVISMVLGLILVFWPGASARTLFVVLGAVALVMGVAYFVTSRQLPAGSGERRMMTTTGIIAAVVGLVLVLWPGAAVVTLSWIVAFAALLVGTILVVIGLRLKQAPVQVTVIEQQGPDDELGPR